MRVRLRAVIRLCAPRAPRRGLARAYTDRALTSRLDRGAAAAAPDIHVHVCCEPQAQVMCKLSASIARLRVACAKGSRGRRRVR